MKQIARVAALSLSLTAFPAFAHHPAEDIVDAETWAMIDALVADTPHAELTFDDMGGGMSETTIDTRTLGSLERMVDDGLLDYVSMLAGEVAVTIDFNADGSVTTTISEAAR